MKTRGDCIIRWVAGIAVLLLWVSCATEPVTGRRQFNMVSAGEEAQLGLTTFEKIKKETPISKNPAVNALVQRVGKRIAAVADLPNAQWEFVVFESKEANAFCLPGGKVGVYTGILPITKDELGMATVIGHEVGHAVAHHGGERMSQAMAVQLGGEVLGAATASADPHWQQLAAVAYGVGSQVGVLLPYSRVQESSADRIGLNYMARAGYDPEAAVAFWERFAEYSRERGSGGPVWLRTHPADEQRIQQIKHWLPEAKQQYRPGSSGRGS
jgi:metalloendopeptidase OMA1, mitochondrial